MAINVTVAEVRQISGAPIALISNDDITALISSISDKAEQFFQVKFTPTKKIEILTGGWKDKIVVEEYFPLKALEVRNGSTTMDLTNIFVHTYEGYLEIYGETIAGEYSSRFSGWDIDVKLKYLYGAMEKDSTAQSEANGAVTAGTSKTITVDDSSSFSANDYIFIEDLNRAYELAQITSVPDGTSIVVDQLVNPYEDDAVITKARTMEIFNQYVLYETALAVAVNAIGGTYTLATSYSYPEYTVTKGVPYTHWTNNFDRNIKARDDVLARIKGILATVV